MSELTYELLILAFGLMLCNYAWAFHLKKSQQKFTPPDPHHHGWEVLIHEDWVSIDEDTMTAIEIWFCSGCDMTHERTHILTQSKMGTIATHRVIG
jgi:hypothetical protein